MSRESMTRESRTIRAVVVLATCAAAACAACAGGDAPAVGDVPPVDAALQAQLANDERSALAALPAGAGHDLLVSNCLSCHSPQMITQQHKDTAGWNKTITQMVAWGAPLAPAQQGVLVAYLAEQYPARPVAPAAP